ILRDTTPPPGIGFPNATPLMTNQVSIYENRPSYYRVNGFETYQNIGLELSSDKFLRSARVGVDTAFGWEKSGYEVGFTPPVYTTSNSSLTLSPGGQNDVFGFWQTPLLEFMGADGELTAELDADRVYELRARVGTDEKDPLRVPDFRLRLITGGSDEAVTMNIS